MLEKSAAYALLYVVAAVLCVFTLLVLVFAVILLILVMLGAIIRFFHRLLEGRRTRRQAQAKAEKARRDHELVRERAHLKQSERARLRALFADDPHLLELCAPRPAIRRGI